ncbi:CDP-glycerol glycerophosphotransferase family protein [Robertmurraya massiliosenegalensis]
MFSLLPINKCKITFASYRSEKLEGNLRFIYEEFNRRNLGFKVDFLFKKYTKSPIGKLNYAVHMLKACHALATSRFFIIDDFYFPVYVIKPRNGMDIVQLWHAAGAFKKFGLSTVGKSFGPSREYLEVVKVHSNYSKVYVSSKHIVSHYAEAFDMAQDKIYPLGVPRTDYFFKMEKRQEIEKRFDQLFPKLKGKKRILYAPTFRGGSHNQELYNCPFDIELLRENIGDNYTLLIHLHPYMRKGIRLESGLNDFAVHLDNEFTIEELMLLSDILITDYSSVIFDYSLLHRPIAFFSNDLEEYIQERDFYYDFKSFIPGPLFDDTQSLADWIKQEKFDYQRISQFREYFFDILDGQTSKRIVTHLLSNGK